MRGLFLVAQLFWHPCTLSFCALNSITATSIPGGTLLELAFHVEVGSVGYVSFGDFTEPLIPDTWRPYAVEGSRGVVGGGPKQSLDDGWEWWSPTVQRYELWTWIGGCENPATIPGMGGWRTCDAFGETGTVTYDFTFHHPVDVNDLWLETDRCYYDKATTCNVPNPQLATTTTPEPATWAMLGVGLMGLYGIRRRTRCAT